MTHFCNLVSVIGPVCIRKEDYYCEYYSKIQINKSRGENQKGVSDISPTLQERQNKNFTIV